MQYPAEQNQEDLDMSAYAPSGTKISLAEAVHLSFNCLYTAEQILKGDLYNVSAYASDAVRALAEALHNCFQYKPYTSTNCDGTELDWNFTFTGQTVCIYKYINFIHIKNMVQFEGGCEI